MERWRLIVSAAAPGARQLALDQAMAEAVQAGQQPPTLRFYAWWPRALSLGYRQPYAVVDAALARAQGVDVVRRPTGGQAILHNDELTYAIALPRQHTLAAGGVRASYQRLSQGLVAGLHKMGLAPDVSDPLPLGRWQGEGLLNPLPLVGVGVRGPVARPSGRDSKSQGPPVICFATPSAHELVVRGHKLVGSAQSRTHRGLLQHGSIALSHDPDVYPLLRAAPPPAPLQGLRDVLPSLPSVGGLIETFAAGFAERLHVSLHPAAFSRAEGARADELVQVRYASDAWTQRV